MAPVQLAKSFNLKDFFVKRTAASQAVPHSRARKSIQCDQSLSACEPAASVSVFPQGAFNLPSTLESAATDSAPSDLIRWASSSLVSTLRGLKFSTHTLQHLSNVWPTTGFLPTKDAGLPQQPSVEKSVTAASSAPIVAAQPAQVQPTAEELAQYVQPVSKLAIKRARVYADLADLAYDVARLSVAFLFSRHKLILVKTSQGDDAAGQQKPRSDTVSANNIVPFSGGAVQQVPGTRPLTPQQGHRLPSAGKQSTSAVGGNSIRQTPLDWFACDNPANGTRIFAIQGSVSLQHWAINLSFDPVTFGEESLGVKVHRGVYETALALYDQLLPLVVDHLKTSPKARVSFTGHSLGGSVASVLMLLYVFNGVLQPHQVSPVYTFGAPAVFCEAPVIAMTPGVHVKHTSSSSTGTVPLPLAGLKNAIPPSHEQELPLTPTQILQGAVTTKCNLTTNGKCCRSLLRVMGVPEDSICNVIMHHDIVPRAFVCDYSSVSEFMRSWGPAFRHHVGLSPVNRHKVMYDFIGVVCVLQPDRRQEFVLGDEYHNMLPPFPHLYSFTLPEHMLEDACISLRQAVLTFMNNPHPLTILSDYQSYGERGLISRYHNPQHYAKALFGLLRKSL